MVTGWSFINDMDWQDLPIMGLENLITSGMNREFQNQIYFIKSAPLIYD